MTIAVRETISHGTYRNVRVVELPDAAPLTVAHMVRDCPYVPLARDAMVARLAMALRSGGSYSHGWVDWEVVRECA